MHEASLHGEVESTLHRLLTTHQGLGEQLEKAYGYAIFPAVGRAAAVIGVAAGDGEVFEQGKPIGFANLRQITVGVQLGGLTFAELLLFDTKEALDHFKSSPVTFTANASAVLVKAAATGTTDFGGVTAMAFAQGGEMLELSLGGQKFNFLPPGAAAAKAERKGAGRERLKRVASTVTSRVASKLGRHPKAERPEAQHEERPEEQHEERHEAQPEEQHEAKPDQSPQPPAT